MTLRVCICDDDPLISSLLKLSLSAAGFQVDEPIGSLPEAVAVLGSSPPDVLLLDLNMPVGGGLELLSHLRDNGLLEWMQVLMLTGEDDVYFMERARSLGASGYLTKPLNLPLLIERIRRVAGDRRVRWVDDLSTVVSPAEAATPSVRARAAVPVLAEPGAPPPHRILSVEDVACNQQLISLFLEAEPCVVDQAATGAQALEALRATRYDLLLIDLRLPDMDGLDVVRRVRRGEALGQRLPIVMISADVLASHLADAKAAGVDDYVVKPFTSAKLVAAVQRRLGAPAGLGVLNPVVTELLSSYGKGPVEKLLRALLRQLATFQAAPCEVRALGHAAHSLKGAAGSLGFTTVYNACIDLEAACRAGDTVDSRRRHATAAACTDAHRAIDTWLASAA